MGYSGKFVVFEGLDGSGKSTQVSLFVKYLQEKGYDVLLTKEPTDNKIGKLIKKMLKDNEFSSPHILQLLFAADRADHIENEIIPALKEGKIVVCDRYLYSSIAYGSIDLDMDWLYEVNKEFLHPNITFHIRVPPLVCFQRINSKNGNNKTLFEKPEKLEMAATNYDRTFKSFSNVSIIDGNRPVDEVFGNIIKEAKSKIGIK